VVGGKPWSGSGETRTLPAISEGGSGSPRVPPLSAHDDLAPQNQHFLDRIVRTRGWISPAFQVLLHTPDVAERMAHIGAFFLYETILPPPIRTLTWLIAAREIDCNYAWAASVGPARAAGVDGKLIAALENGKPLPSLSKEQQVLFDFCHQLLRGNHHVSDATYAEAVEAFGVPAAVQIAGTLGYFLMMGLVANVFEVAPVSDNSRPAL
jgi:4-carboxymuconolactone decarboxylase